MVRILRNFFFFSTVLLSLLVSASSSAKQVIIPAPPQVAAVSYIVMDANTGKVLVDKDIDNQRPPASMTKMMTSYIVSSYIERGTIRPDDMVEISVKAWKMGGSKMFIREGTQVPVIDLLRGVIIQSGNDASVALAEHIAGNEEAFTDIMNQQAELLGMNNTVFKNATGWPEEGQYSTARDLAILGQALIRDFPEHYKLYAEKSFSYNNIDQSNRNLLLFRDKTVDGIKTGHTEEAGYGLVASSKKNGMRLISVVMGTRSKAARASETQKLLSYGFRYYQTHKLYNKEEELNVAKLWKGKAQTIALGITKDVYLTIPKGSKKDLLATMNVDKTIEAPISQGQELGNIVVTLVDEELVNIPVVALESVEQAGFFTRISHGFQLFFKRFFKAS